MGVKIGVFVLNEKYSRSVGENRIIRKQFGHKEK
jgi:hypothetical protein